MLKKVLKVSLMMLIVFLTFQQNSAFAETIIIDTWGEGKGPNTGTYPGVNRVDPSKQWSSDGVTGTLYTIKVVNDDGSSTTVIAVLKDGEIPPNCGNMQGYGSFGAGEDDNPLPTGGIEIYPDDFENYLRYMGKNEIADKIANGCDYEVEVEQVLNVSAPGVPREERDWVTATWMRERIAAEKAFYYPENPPKGTFWYDQYGPWNNSAYAWKDPLADNPYKGVYKRHTFRTPTPGTPTPGTPTPGTPTPSTPTPKPIFPELQYKLYLDGDNACKSAPPVSSTLVIGDENNYFGVAAQAPAVGNPIPTSENLTLNVNTNWLANLVGIKNAKLKIESAKDIYLYVSYIEKVKEESWDVEYTYKDESGEWHYNTTNYKKRDIGAHEYEMNKETKYKDIGTEDGVDGREYQYTPIWAEKPLAFDLSATLMDESKTEPVNYLYTGDAKIEGGLEAGVDNAVLPGGSAKISIGNFGDVTIKMNGNYPVGCFGAWDDHNRVSRNKTYPIRESECCLACAQTLGKEYLDGGKIGAGYFYNVETDKALTLQSSSHSSIEPQLGCNRAITCQDFGASNEHKESVTEGIGKIPSDRKNNSGSGYPSSNGWIKIGNSRRNVSPVNSVRVHTPIYAELTVKPESKNQLTNNSLRNGEKIVTLGEEFEATLKVYGQNTVLYKSLIRSDWPRRMTKYIRSAEITCGFCRQTIDVTALVIKYGEATHKCRAYVDFSDDLSDVKISGKVVAENNPSISSSNCEDHFTNTPDNSYAIRQSKGLFIVGRIYGLQVRATDDPSWKLKNLEDLSYLPTGENGDNSVSAYKNGIKLGYRAYYDLKTLGTGSEEVELTPKIYYVDKNGTLKGEIGNQYELWFKTSSTNYEKLQSGKDIITKMKVATSKPDAFNIPFKEECAKLMSRLISKGVATIDYNKLITNMGGLLGLTLRKDNTVATKYTYLKNAMSTNEVFDYTDTVDKSRRWYGEIYVPASTRIIAKGNYTTNKTKVTNGTGIIKDGYIVVVFENIKSKTASGADYLKYDEVRDPEWNIPTGVKSQLETEKNGKTTIKLPNGKTFTAYAKNDAPIIIYDVSLRANNDYEQTGTH